MLLTVPIGSKERDYVTRQVFYTRGQEMNVEDRKRQAKQKALQDMREDAPNNPYECGTVEYWAYANEVNNEFNREFLRL